MAKKKKTVAPVSVIDRGIIRKDKLRKLRKLKNTKPERNKQESN